MKNNLGLSIQRILSRYMAHTLLRETSADSLAGQILKAFIVVGPEDGTVPLGSTSTGILSEWAD